MAYRPITTHEGFEQMVKLGVTPETKHLEFKGAYGWRTANKDEQAIELCRDIAQFANADGGVLLVGVTEAEEASGRRVAGTISGVDDIEGFKNWLEQAIRNYLTPSTFSRSVIPIATKEGWVLAVNIPATLHLVALWHKKPKAGIEYLYRTDHGKQWMNPDEVERHLMNASRAARLAVQEVKARASSTGPVELVPPVSVLAYDGHGTGVLVVARDARPVLNNCGERSFGMVVYTEESNRCIEIPYGVVRDAWVTTDGRPGLYLSVRLLMRIDGDVTMEPLDQGLPAAD